MKWTVETFGDEVDAEIAALPPDMSNRLIRLLDLIEDQGLDKLPANAVKHLRDKLWELRFGGRDGIARAIYLTWSGRRVVILRVFVKKEQKTPKHELQLAQDRAKALAQRRGSA